jgi:hypothetical protein
MRLIVQPGTAHVRGRGMVKQFFLDGVLVEPGDGAQLPGDGGTGAAAGFQVAGEALDVGAAGGEQPDLVLLAPGGGTGAGPARTPAESGRCSRPGTRLTPAAGSGDILLVRTGWMTKFHARRDTTPSAGLNWRCAEWLHERDVAAIAADNSQVEDPISDLEGNMLPMHLLCLRDMGLAFGEYWDLDALADDCAAGGRWEMQLVAPPLRITGAVGSPINPIALR